MLRPIFEKLLIVFHFLRYRFFIHFDSRFQLEDWQQEKLEQHLKFLKEKSPFYEARLREPWNQTEPIDKSVMMKNFDTLNTRGLKGEKAIQLALKAEQSRDFSPMLGDVTVGLSSGTSGHRGLFCADFFERAAYAGAILAKALPPGGLLRKHRVAFFLRANSNLYESVGSSRLAFHYFDLLEPLDKHVHKLQQVQPTILIGPPSLLSQLANQMTVGQLKLKKLERIYSVAEVLDPVDERRIQKAFGQTIHQIYQCTEGFLAITCEHGSLHLNEDLVIVEKQWLNKAEGKFMPILTDLNRRTQPIVRYRLNDILTEHPEPCPCGSVFTRLKMIEGRCDDMLEFPHGEEWRSVFPDFVRNAILFASSGIDEYRVTQARNRDLTIALRGREALPVLEAAVQTQLQNLAERLDCTLPPLKFDHDFPPLAGRKLRRVIREV